MSSTHLTWIQNATKEEEKIYETDWNHKYNIF